MTLRLSIDMDNAAFDDNGNGSEVSAILRRLANRVSEETLCAGDNLRLYDSNGNTVGRVEVEK